jgi:hypothetical protein
VTFKEAVEKTPHLENTWNAGLQALRSEDKRHIQADDTRQLRGSVDIDSSLKQFDPNANRWDFAIAYQHENREEEFIYWVELHTASDAEVKVVLSKASWLLEWLKADGANLNLFEREIVWVSSGATLFTPNSPQRKLLAAHAVLKHRGTVLRIRNNRPD